MSCQKFFDCFYRLVRSLVSWNFYPFSPEGNYVFFFNFVGRGFCLSHLPEMRFFLFSWFDVQFCSSPWSSMFGHGRRMNSFSHPVFFQNSPYRSPFGLSRFLCKFRFFLWIFNPHFLLFLLILSLLIWYLPFFLIEPHNRVWLHHVSPQLQIHYFD